MRKLLAAIILFISVSAFGAVPAFTDFFGTNGILIMTNGALGSQKVQVDGRYVQPATANLTNWSDLSTNSILSAASNRVVVLAGSNTTVNLTSTNGTNFYTVGSTATGGGSSGTNNPSFAQLYAPTLNQTGLATTNEILFSSAVYSNTTVNFDGGGTYYGFTNTDAGYYLVSAMLTYAADDTQPTILMVLTNGVHDERFTGFAQVELLSATNTVSFSGVAYYPAGTYFKLASYNTAIFQFARALFGITRVDGMGGSSSGSGNATNAVTSVSTNGTFVLSSGVTNLDFVYGVTGYVSGATVKLGVSASGSGDAGGTNSRQFGSASLTNLQNNANVATNLAGYGAVFISSNNAGTWSITGNVLRATYFYVSTLGDDSTATSNSVVFPWRNIDTAHTAMTNANIPGSIMEIDSNPGGSYSVTNAIVMPDYSEIRGNGYVKLLSYVEQSTNGPLFTLGSESTIRNIIGIAAKSNVASYYQSFAGVYGYATGNGNNHAFTNAHIVDCDWIGDYDGIIVAHSNKCSLFVESSLFNTKADCVFIGSAIDGNTNTFVSFDGCTFINTNASQVYVGYNPIGLSVHQGTIRLKDSYVFIRPPIGSIGTGISVDGGNIPDGRGRLEFINNTIICQNSNGFNTGLQIENHGDLALYTPTNVFIRSPGNLEYSRLSGPMELGNHIYGLTDIIIPVGQDLKIRSWDDGGINVVKTNYVMTDRSKSQLIVTNLTLHLTSPLSANGITNNATLYQNQAAEFDSSVQLNTAVSGSTIIRTDPSGFLADTGIGEGLNWDGTTISGSTNFNNIEVTNSVTVLGSIYGDPDDSDFIRIHGSLVPDTDIIYDLGAFGTEVWRGVYAKDFVGTNLLVYNTSEFQGVSTFSAPIQKTVGKATGTTTITIDGSLNTRTSVLTSATTAIFSNLLAGQTVRWYVFSSNGSFAISFPQSHSSNTVDYPLPQPYTNTWAWYEATVLSTGQTNFSGSAQQYGLVSSWGHDLRTNEANRTIWLDQTNHIVGIATNATSVTADFSDAVNAQEYHAWFHLTTNLVISPTNLVQGRTMKFYFGTNALTYDVVFTNTAATRVNWNFNVSTNGSTSFTKTNSLRARVYLTAETNGTLNAELGYYR